MSEKFEYCEECNTPLSQCGPEGVDGIPTMDCIACKLRDIIAEKDKRIAELEKSFQMSQEARKGWLAEFDGYKDRITDARTIIQHIGYTSADDEHVIQAAIKWLKGKP